jgi:hypothetical protein
MIECGGLAGRLHRSQKGLSEGAKGVEAVGQTVREERRRTRVCYLVTDSEPPYHGLAEPIDANK